MKVGWGDGRSNGQMDTDRSPVLQVFVLGTTALKLGGFAEVNNIKFWAAAPKGTK